MTDEELINIVQSHPDRAVTAVEIAEKVDMSSTGVLKRLDQLEKDGVLTKKKVGSRAVVWWVSKN